MAAGDRNALLERLKSVYNYLHKQNGVELLNFATADMKTLLRVQAPANHGDDLSQNRAMVVAANRSQAGQSGIEAGRRGLALRGIAPVMQGSTLVGTAEVGFDLPGLIRAIRARTGSEVVIVLSVGMGAQTQDRKVYGDLVLQNSTDHALFTRLLELSPPRLAREDWFGEVTVDGATWGIIVTPMLDFSGRMIGGFIGAQNYTVLYAEFRRQLWELGLLALAGLLVCYGIVAVALRAFVSRPLADVGSRLEDAANGQRAAENTRLAGAAEADRIIKAATRLADSAGVTAPNTPAASTKVRP